MTARNWTSGEMRDGGRIDTRYSYTHQDSYTREEAEADALARSKEDGNLYGVAPLVKDAALDDDDARRQDNVVALYHLGVRFAPEWPRHDGDESPRCPAVSSRIQCSRVSQHVGSHAFDDVPAVQS